MYVPGWMVGLIHTCQLRTRGEFSQWCHRHQKDYPELESGTYQNFISDCSATELIILFVCVLEESEKKEDFRWDLNP